MVLRYGLIPNHLTDDPDDYMGMVTDNETVTTEQIVEQMIGKGSTVTKAEALSVIEEFSYAVVQAVASGNNVNTELFKVYPSISGVFANESDGFDKKRHAIRLNLNAGPRLTDAVGNIELRKVEISHAQPVIQQFADLKTKAVNETFSPGQIASLKGSFLKFDEEDANQGIFFIAAEGTVTKVGNVVKNKPSELLFFVPETLKTGSFQVEVRAAQKNSKNIKTGRLLVDLVPVS
ncbi:DNA-binding domain-containing protein [Labilibaculum sp. K2S]|uniref:DNA-binding domain-containing protein n=1 Tax=Labilibaculum sp. K2S TaxID=3056386 RepID=UPI0025A338A6|nr:DNA-binding domain-containing protein [Labilibaculum sp. K2S]MDM8158182.1 DNA-binding domain-containing protein [Labilibaculum sp. K2S]